MGCVYLLYGVVAILQGFFMEIQCIFLWSNDYYFNINIEMIYWLVLVFGKYEYFDLFWAMLEDWMFMLEVVGCYFYENDKVLFMFYVVDNCGYVVGNFWMGMIDQACVAWMVQLVWLQYQYILDE